jgi:hypothetical protein
LLKPAAEGFTELYWNIALKIVAEGFIEHKDVHRHDTWWVCIGYHGKR